MTDPATRPATERAPSLWRNPMLWLVIGLPSAVIVAALATLAIAIESGGSDAIPDKVRRTAQIQTTELGPDERAATLKLSAVLSVHTGDGEAALELLPASGALFDSASDEGRALRPVQRSPDLARDRRRRALQRAGNAASRAALLQHDHDGGALFGAQVLVAGSHGSAAGSGTRQIRGVALDY